MSLPPMNHEHAVTLAQQAALLGSEMWELVEDDELAPLMDHVLSALIYLHGYASQVEQRMVELLDSNKAMAALLEAQLDPPANPDAWEANYFAQTFPTSVVPAMRDIPADVHGALFGISKPPAGETVDPLLLVDDVTDQAIERALGVTWKGSSGDYFANMEAINAEIAREFGPSSPTDDHSA